MVADIATASEVPRVETLPWDSSEFGLSVAQLTVTGELTDVEIAALVTARSRGVELVYLQGPEISEASRKRLTNAAAIADLYEDARIVFEKRLTGSPVLTTPDGLRLCSFPTGMPSEALAALAEQAGEHSRFRRDPRFPRAAFERLYAEWIRRSTLREVCSDVVVAAPTPPGDSRLLGFVTVAVAGDVANVGLVAVAPHARKQGVGKALMSRAEATAWTANCTTVRVVTQRANELACQFYERAGYQLVARSFVYHLWLT